MGQSSWTDRLQVQWQNLPETEGEGGLSKKTKVDLGLPYVYIFIGTHPPTHIQLL